MTGERMRSVSDLFDAKALHLWDTMTSHSNTAGFRIPNYQRSYDWSHENIHRLLDDCLNGFYYLSQDTSGSFTFLGTLILVRESAKEQGFDGTSLSVVDGQQRLTTLILIACALIEEITNHFGVIDAMPTNEQEWIRQEAVFHIDCLYQCAIGIQTGRSQNFPYPRLVRDVLDERGRGTRDSEYTSSIAKFLMAFSNYYANSDKIFNLPELSSSGENERFVSNYLCIKEKIANLSVQEMYEEWESQYLTADAFIKRGVKELFEKTGVLDGPERDRAFSYISTEASVEPLIRLLLFSSYLTKCVVLTSVETDSVDSAFDIFDSLNTTGEPLTALETLKPRVIQFEDRCDGYKGSESELAFSEIERNLNDLFASSDIRQRETKDLLVSFALYINGHKLPKELGSQRTWLRTTYDLISRTNIFAKRRFVQSIADMAVFRASYWNKSGIEQLATFHSDPGNRSQIQLCMRLIADMGTSMVLPVLARYWLQFKRNNNEEEFVSAVRALTAFVVLRRASTGTTAGIDSVLRGLMTKRTSSNEDPLSAGIDHSHVLINVQSLKEELRKELASPRIGINDKRSWVIKVSEIPLGSLSRPLAKFLILAAAHRSEVDGEENGLWTRENVRASDSNDYLNYNKWTCEAYSTVEHVAPESYAGSEWDDRIYASSYIRHTLGNLTLLPQRENSSIGNVGWPKKKLFYLAVTEKRLDEQQQRFEEAKAAGFQFQNNLVQLLSAGERLELLDPIRNVDDWTIDFIKKRTENITNLAWDSIAPWLYE